jgi:hypothetical protein
LKGGRNDFPKELAGFAVRDTGKMKLGSKEGTEEEATSLEANYNGDFG